MKTIYYFLQWHWKKYKCKTHHVMPVIFVLFFGGVILASYKFTALGGSMILSSLIISIVFFLKWVLWDPIYNSFQEYKEEQRNLLDKINYGEKDYERFRKR